MSTMTRSMDHPATALCAQCGIRGVGPFCSNCASPLRLDDESVSAELGAKIIHPLIGLLSFVKTAWLVALRPRVFFRSYATADPPLSDLSFPLAGIWRRLSAKPQRVMRPFQALATAIGLVALTAGLEDWAWRVTAFSERAFGMSKAEMTAATRQNLSAFYEKQFGHALTILDTAHLTGVSLLDAPVHEIVKLLHYMYFPLVVSLFLIGRSIKRPMVMHLYVYAIAANVGMLFVTSLFGLGAFMLFQAVSPDAAVLMSGLPSLVGVLTSIYLVVVLPIVVLPEILSVSRARVVVATLAGGVLWMLGNYVVSQVMVFGLGILLT